MKISVTLPSLYPDALEQSLDNIYSTTHVHNVEVLVCSPSPFAVRARAACVSVTWIEETKSHGCNFAQVIASKHATGDLIIAHTDDFAYIDGWDEKIVSDFLDRERLHGENYLMGLRYDVGDQVGTVFGMYYANFPMMRRSNIGKFGWLGPEYRIGFGDSDLSMRIWDGGGVCEFSKEKILYPVRIHDGRPLDSVRKEIVYSDEDFAQFVSKWSDRYGRGWMTEYLEQFNINVDLGASPRAVHGSGRTIRHNDPSFRSLL